MWTTFSCVDTFISLISLATLSLLVCLFLSYFFKVKPQWVWLVCRFVLYALFAHRAQSALCCRRGLRKIRLWGFIKTNFSDICRCRFRNSWRVSFLIYLFFTVAGHMWSQQLWHAGRGRCGDYVRPQKKLLGHWRQWFARCFHSCTWAWWEDARTFRKQSCSSHSDWALSLVCVEGQLIFGGGRDESGIISIIL